MEKIFDDYKGVVLFYLVVVILSILFVCKFNLDNDNIVKTNEKMPSITYHA